MPDAISVTAARDQLRLLSIFHYVLAGVTGLFSLFPLIHVGLGIAIVSGKLPFGAKGTPPPDAFGWIFIGVGAFFPLGTILGVFTILALAKTEVKALFEARPALV